MKKFAVNLLASCAAFAMLAVFSSCNKNKNKKELSGGLTIEQGTLKIGMEVGYPPFEYFDADGTTPIGFDVQLGAEIARRLGLKVEYVDTAWDGIFAGLDTNRYDIIISAMTITADRLANYNFSKAYIGNAQSIIVHKDSDKGITTPSDLEGLKVGFQAETTSDFYMRNLRERTGLNFEGAGYDKVMNAYDDLKFKRIDAVCSDSLVAVKYLTEDNSEFKKVWEGVAEEFFGVCISKKNPALLEKVNKAMDDMIADGTLSKIYMNIFGGDLLYTIKDSPYNK
ncbi:MAG: amino acid ABC transporter substrate-binding protein [Treponema sp.]|nr:amino acid ABC transporter substrate-binding protein [Treponema sp.]